MANIQHVDFEDNTALSTLIRHIVPYAAELPHSLALELLRQSYIKFARRTSLLTARIGIEYQKDVREYLIPPPEGYRNHIVLGYEDAHGHAVPDTFGLPCSGKRFFVEGSQKIRLNYSPSRDGEELVYLYVSVIPEECVDTIPRDIAEPYGAGIAKGALANALTIPNKSWTDFRLASKMELDYHREVQAGRQLANSNRQAGPLKAKRRRIV